MRIDDAHLRSSRSREYEEEREEEGEEENGASIGDRRRKERDFTAPFFSRGRDFVKLRSFVLFSGIRCQGGVSKSKKKRRPKQRRGVGNL